MIGTVNILKIVEKYLITDRNPPIDIQTESWNPPIYYKKDEIEDESRSG